MTDFAAALRTAREVRSLTAKDMASALGISQQYLTDLESGRRGANPRLCTRIAALEESWGWPSPPEGFLGRWHLLGARDRGWRVGPEGLVDRVQREVMGKSARDDLHQPPTTWWTWSTCAGRSRR